MCDCVCDVLFVDMFWIFRYALIDMSLSVCNEKKERKEKKSSINSVCGNLSAKWLSEFFSFYSSSRFCLFFVHAELRISKLRCLFLNSLGKLVTGDCVLDTVDTHLYRVFHPHICRFLSQFSMQYVICFAVGFTEIDFCIKLVPSHFVFQIPIRLWPMMLRNVLAIVKMLMEHTR